ncbi:MAG: hypothetical protein NTW92_00785 [Bacteroidetes bacterium]|nr:hypothetical protein [Bacteroidota bacterium]
MKIYINRLNRNWLLVVMLLSCSILKAQTGIGTTTPDASAKLDVSSSNKGFLPPRIALTASNSASPVTSPATGLLIFNTATAGSIPNQVTPGYYYWDGVNAKWVRLEDKADNLGNHTATANILLNGNYLSNDGGSEGIRVDNSGNVGIGTNTPTSKLNIAGGGVRIASGMSNASTRPSVNTSNIGNYEIRGVGGGSPQIDGQDDGFLRLSAGGGTSAVQQSSIDLSGYSASVPDMSSNIVMRTAGTERVRIDNSGTVNITGKINVTDPSGNVVVKAAGFVNAGVALTFGNIQVQMIQYGNLQIKTTGSSFTGVASAYTSYNWNNFTLYSDRSFSVDGTFRNIGDVAWGFYNDGDLAIYYVKDVANARFWRITLMAGPTGGATNNFISIERLL